MINQGYGYNDISVIPAVISEIKSRSECFPFQNATLPIFTAPMDSVINLNNIQEWEDNKIIPIIPRNISYTDRIQTCINGIWTAFGLDEFKQMFVDTPARGVKTTTEMKALIDVANGHMKQLYDLCNQAKQMSREYGYKLTIMVGNIANPETYKWICENAEVDYVRCAIGSGAGCITSSNTGIHYPIASLINECYKIKKNIRITTNQEKSYYDIETPYHSEIRPSNDFHEVHYIKYKSRPYIIADGGIRNYSDVIKALVLGADYVMIGGLFASFLESAASFDCCASKLINYEIDIDFQKILKMSEDEKLKFVKENKLIKEFHGMASRKGQIAINGEKTKTSEGISKKLEVKYTIKQWADNMADYMRSAMSYCNCKKLDSFIGYSKVILNSPAEIAAINK